LEEGEPASPGVDRVDARRGGLGAAGDRGGEGTEELGLAGAGGTEDQEVARAGEVHHPGDLDLLGGPVDHAEERLARPDLGGRTGGGGTWAVCGSCALDNNC